MKELLGMNSDEMHEVFKKWNEGDLDSYLIEITRDILGFKDDKFGFSYLLMNLVYAGNDHLKVLQGCPRTCHRWRCG